MQEFKVVSTTTKMSTALDDLQETLGLCTSAAAPSTISSSAGANRPLAVLLMEILNDEVAGDAIWWLPCGKAFAVDPDIAPSKILDIYFNGTKVSSFVRQLNNA